jgi:putative transposase
VSSVIKWAARKRSSGSIVPGKMGGYPARGSSLPVLAEVARDLNMTLYRLSVALAEWGLHVHPASVGGFLHREGKSFSVIVPAGPRLEQRIHPQPPAPTKPAEPPICERSIERPASRVD